ncbi:MAG: serine/threonine protein phosphatase [Spirochaetales bacterium]|nr:serine/threonine protein phosphatase [Spirochaetales bacterium]
MKMKEFLSSLSTLAASADRVVLDGDSKLVFLSDLHLGDGSPGDDGRRNAPLLEAALGSWYEPSGFELVLNGDVEELHKFTLGSIMEAHRGLYELFDRFAARGALRKIVGNHDLGLLAEKGYPYRLEHAVRYEWKGRPILAYHGHQASRFFVDYNYLSDFVVRWLANPLRIKNAEFPLTSKRRFKTERRVYRASRRLGLVSVIGHTHRPLFESLTKYDRLRHILEDLLRRYTMAEADERAELSRTIDDCAAEFSRVSSTRRGADVGRSLYAESDALLPCLFNSGCATGRHGATALEIAAGRIALVHWTRAGTERPYIAAEASGFEDVPGTPYRRWVLAEEPLDYVFARLELLGRRKERSEAETAGAEEGA